MAYYCEHCGKVLQDGEVCTCSGANPMQAPPPVQQQPPQPTYIPPAQVGQQPYPPQPGQPMPGQPAQPSQVQQTFNEFASSLGGFAKDPFTAATQNKSVGASFLFLAIEALTFLFIFMYIFSASGLTEMMRYLGQSSFGLYMRVVLYIAVEIALMFGCLMAMNAIVKIQINAKATLSAVSSASIPWSCAFLLTLIFMVLFNGSPKLLSFLQVVVFCFAIAASMLLLEIGIRANMPEGTGNVARLISISVAFAVQAGISVLLLEPLLNNAAGSLTSFF